MQVAGNHSELRPDPVAAASLGQVYKGKLQPRAARMGRCSLRCETVSIDLYIIRRLGLALRNVPAGEHGWKVLLDEWGVERFFEELNYVKEGENATQFAASIDDDLPAGGGAANVRGHASQGDHVVEWLEGEKLSQSTADDVGDLAEHRRHLLPQAAPRHRFFHADPHPGNLIRTPDGRLAILDFGLMTDIDDNIKFRNDRGDRAPPPQGLRGHRGGFCHPRLHPRGRRPQAHLFPFSRRLSTSRRSRAEAKNINFRKWRQICQITFDYPFRIPSLRHHHPRHRPQVSRRRQPGLCPR